MILEDKNPLDDFLREEVAFDEGLNEDDNIDDYLESRLIASEELVKEVIFKLKQIVEIKKHNIAEIKRLINTLNFVGLVLYLSAELEIDQSIIDEVLVLLGESPEVYKLILSVDAPVDDLLYFVETQLNATTEEISDLRTILTLENPELISTFNSIELQRFVLTFKRLSGFRNFPSRLFQLLMETVFSIEDYLRAISPESRKELKLEQRVQKRLPDGRFVEEVIITPIRRDDFRNLSHGDILHINGVRYYVRDGELYPIRKTPPTES